MRIVIDSNIWISSLISKSLRDRLFKVIGNASIDIFISEKLLWEIEDVAQRPKFRKRLSKEQIKTFIDIIKERSELISPDSKVDICRDENDNFLLAICKDATINFLITGDKDLIVLNPFDNTQIISLSDFEAILID